MKLNELSLNRKITFTVGIIFSASTIGLVKSFESFLSFFLHENDKFNKHEIYSKVLAIRLIVYLSTLKINGAIFTKLNKQIGLIISLFILSFCGIIETEPNVTIKYILSAFIGFVYSVCDVCIYSLILDIWKEQSQRFIHVLIFAVDGSGFLMTYFIRYMRFVIFKSESEPEHQLYMTHRSSQPPTFDYNTSRAVNHLQILLVTGLPPLIASLVLLYFFVSFKRRENNLKAKSNLTVISTTQVIHYANYQPNVIKQPFASIDSLTANSSGKISAKIIITSSLLILFASIARDTMGTSIYPIMFDLQVPVSSIAMMVSIITSTYIFANLILALISMRFSPEKIISFFLCFMVIGSPVFFFLNLNLTSYGIGYVLMSVGFSPVLPSVLAILEKESHVSSLVVGLFLFVRDAPFMISGVASTLFKNNPIGFGIISTSCSLISVGLVVILLISIKK